MHIPDNYLSPATCAIIGISMVPIWKKAINKVNEKTDKKELPLLGICAAFSFLTMMLNIPLPGGTTGHAVGAALVAILIGPNAAVISITTALAIQALFFGDGGILAFGVNTFNMAFIMPFVGFYLYKFIKGSSNNKRREYIAVFISSYVALNVAVLLAGIELGVQPLLFKDAITGHPLYCPYSLKIAIPAILIPHILVAGVLEGLISTGVYNFVKKVSPEMIYETKPSSFKYLYAIIIAMICITPLGLLATGTTWGEWGTEDINKMVGYIPNGMKNGFQISSIMPDYTIKNLSELTGYIVSAITGVIIIFLLFRFMRKVVFKLSEK